MVMFGNFNKQRLINMWFVIKHRSSPRHQYLYAAAIKSIANFKFCIYTYFAP